MDLPGGWELVLIVVAGVLLFGSKRLPDSARAVGRSLRILKAETKGLRDDEPAPAPAPVPAALPPVQPVAQPQPVTQVQAVAQPQPVTQAQPPAHEGSEPR